MHRLHALIFLCLLLPSHRSSLDIVVSRTLTTSVNDSSEKVLTQDINYNTHSEQVSVHPRPSIPIRPQDIIPDHNSLPANRNQDRKSPRIFPSRLITISQPRLGNKTFTNINSSNMQNNTLNLNETLKNDEEMKQVERNTIEPVNTSVTLPVDPVQKPTEIPKTNQKTDSNSTNVSLEDRSSFVGDNCPTGYVKVDGKCVPVKE